MIIYEVEGTEEGVEQTYYPTKEDACRAARILRQEREESGDDCGVKVARCVTVNPDKDGVIRMLEGRGWAVEREVVYRTKGRYWNTEKQESEEG